MFRKSNNVIAHNIEETSVLFCDIVQFTAMSSKISADSLVQLLNIIFSKFDILTDKHKVYKVETIGDCYFACTGVVQRQEDHRQCLVDCALDMIETMKGIKNPNDRRAVSVRIGVHSGPVIAGVVGKKMPRYHLFGETVTIAETIEAKGEPGAVLIRSVFSVVFLSLSFHRYYHLFLCFLIFLQ